MPHGERLAVATLASWLLTEALGVVMVRGWITSGGARASLDARAVRPRQRASTEVMSLPILAGHAGLNLAGLICWAGYVLSGARPLSWLALAFMAPAIGLGISTVTIWTPYPGGRSKEPRQPGVLPPEVLDRALSDEELSQQLVDELLQHNLAERPRLSLRPLIPFGHGVLAIATFLLATLAAIAAL
jgi:hypothetical protein